MKTIAFNDSGRSAVRAAFVLAGLAGLYVYFRRGGTVTTLASRGIQAARTTREALARAVGENKAAATTTAEGGAWANQDAPTDDIWSPSSREIPMAPETMDRFPST